MRPAEGQPPPTQLVGPTAEDSLSGCPWLTGGVLELREEVDLEIAVDEAQDYFAKANY